MKIILSGATGQMGSVIADMVSNLDDMEIVYGISYEKSDRYSFPVFTDIHEEYSGDVLIDFSTPLLLDRILEYGISSNTPLVLATTGYSESEILKIKEASKKIPIVFSGNMSIGVNVMEFVVENLAKMLSGFDIEIIEKHHNKKKDSPSGTAKMLFDAANKGRENSLVSLCGREGFSENRDENIVGISSIRGGNIVGEHSVIFAGEDEVLEIKHIANSKKIFANGAIRAARFLQNKKPGLYNMDDVLEIGHGEN